MTDAEFRAIIASIENASPDELKEMFIETLDDHLSRRTSGSVPELLSGPLMDMAFKAGLPRTPPHAPLSWYEYETRQQSEVELAATERSQESCEGRDSFEKWMNDRLEAKSAYFIASTKRGGLDREQMRLGAYLKEESLHSELAFNYIGRRDLAGVPKSDDNYACAA